MEKKELSALSRAELYDLAIQLNIKGRSAMSKSSLVDALSPKRGIRSLIKQKKSVEPVEDHRSSKSPREEIIEDISKKFEITREESMYQYQLHKPSMEDEHGLPAGYGKDKIVLMVKDPYWIFAYWELTQSTRDRYYQQYKNMFSDKSGFALRIYEITSADVDNPNTSWDILIGDVAKSWYVKVHSANKQYVVDFGVLGLDGKFIKIMRSNIVQTPPAAISDKTDEDYKILLEKYEKIFRLSGGYAFGGASEAIVRYNLLQEIQEHFFGGSVGDSSYKP